MNTKSGVTKKQNAWKHISDIEKQAIFNFGEDYKCWIDRAKTEREAVHECVKELRMAGFVPLRECRNLKAGDKVFDVIKEKCLFAAVVGRRSIQEGVRILAPHIDSPRIALKPSPFYEEAEQVLGQTYYRGGIKMYQWVTIPLALHGIISDKNGNQIPIVFGEDDSEPAFYIPDLATHLSADQGKKSMKEGITAENLNVIMGSIPLKDCKEENAIKGHLLKILMDKYGVTERDFSSAEIHVVPKTKAMDIGFDSGMIAAFGQDDRICGYETLRALIDIEEPETTAIGFFVDREEIGSVGNTGAKSTVFRNRIAELFERVNGEYSEMDFRRTLEKSKALSADVTDLKNPMDPSLYDDSNAGFAGCGVCLDRFMSSSNFEFVEWVTRVLDSEQIPWQMSMLGRERVQFCGSVAASFAHMGMEVVNMGPGIIAMHSPWELVSKLDLYMAYKGYKAFLETVI